LLIGDLFRNKSKCHGEAVATKLAKSERVENALKSAALDLIVPILGSLESYQSFTISSDDCCSLGCYAALVLIAGNLKMFTVLLYLLSDIVHCLHGVDIHFLDDNLQVLGLITLLWRLSIDNIHLLSLVCAQTVLQKDSDSP
jgi:hypothetical protein